MDVATRAWWTVDLGAIVNVKEVAISQRNNYGKSNICGAIVSTLWFGKFNTCTARVRALAIGKSDTCSGNESLAGLQFWGFVNVCILAIHTTTPTLTHYQLSVNICYDMLCYAMLCYDTIRYDTIWYTVIRQLSNVET